MRPRLELMLPRRPLRLQVARPVSLRVMMRQGATRPMCTLVNPRMLKSPGSLIQYRPRVVTMLPEPHRYAFTALCRDHIYMT